MQFMKENSDQRIFEKIQQFSNLDNKIVLEIGCGNGRISSFMADKTKNLIGIDPNDEKIKEAKANIPYGKFLIGSGENIEFENEFFDLVIFALSLHHQDSIKAIKEARRVLKRDGLILVIEPVVEGEVEQIFSIVHNENQENLNAQQAIKNSGLSIVRSEVFEALWVFDSKEELCESIFNYYEMPIDAIIAQKICVYLGERAENKPIELSDTMMIQSLSKMTNNLPNQAFQRTR